MEVWLETSPIARLTGRALALFGAVVLVLTAWQFLWDYEGRQVDRMTRAYDTLSRRVPGNVGAGEAINNLLDMGHSLSGIELSCRSAGSAWDESNLVCDSSPVVAGLRLTDRYLNGWKLFGTEITEMLVRESSLSGDFRGARFEVVAMENVTLFGNFAGATFTNAILNEAILNWNVLDTTVTPRRGLTIEYSDISGLTVETDNALQDILVTYSYAWADLPPTRVSFSARNLAQAPAGELHELLPGVTLCDPRQMRKVPRKPVEVPEPTPMGYMVHWHSCDEMTVSAARAAFPSAWEDIRSPTGNDGE